MLSRREMKRRRGHADDRELCSLQRHTASNRITRSAEATLPQTMADHHDLGGAWLVIFRQKRPPQKWLNAEQREQIRCDAHSFQLFRLAGAGQIESLRHPGGHIRKDLILSAPVREVA